MALRSSISARAPRPTVMKSEDESHDLPQAAPVRDRFAFVNPLKTIKIKTRRPLQGVGGGKTKKLFELTRRPGRVSRRVRMTGYGFVLRKFLFVLFTNSRTTEFIIDSSRSIHRFDISYHISIRFINQDHSSDHRGSRDQS